MFWTTFANALLIFVLRVTDVSLGTLRVTMIMRGQRKWAALIGFVEVTIWVLAISRVISNLETIWNVIGYSGGFAAGTLLGMWIENRLALGNANLTAISMTKGQEIADRVRKEGFGATELQAHGQSGPVYLVNMVAPRRQIPDLIRLINEIDATTFVAVQDTRHVMRGHQRLIK